MVDGLSALNQRKDPSILRTNLNSKGQSAEINKPSVSLKTVLHHLDLDIPAKIASGPALTQNITLIGQVNGEMILLNVLEPGWE